MYCSQIVEEAIVDDDDEKDLVDELGGNLVVDLMNMYKH